MTASASCSPGCRSTRPRGSPGPAHSREAAGEAGFTTLERLWARPTAEINGMWGGYTGPGAKTIIPSDAHAKVSFRLVADQDPQDVRRAMESYVAAAVPPGIEATVTFDGPGVRPCLTPLDAPALQAAARAMQRAFGQEVLFTREGGSGPEADLAEILEAPVIFFGVGLPDDRIHAPNERVVIPMLLRGAEALAYLWDELGALETLDSGSDRHVRNPLVDPRRARAESDACSTSSPIRSAAIAPSPVATRASTAGSSRPCAAPGSTAGRRARPGSRASRACASTRSRGRRAAGRLSRLQAVPAGRQPGLARVGHAGPIWSPARCGSSVTGWSTARG